MKQNNKIRNTFFDCFLVLIVVCPVIAFFIYGLPANRVITIVNPKTETLLATITGYSSTSDQTDNTPDITAYGTQARKGIIANNCLKRGTEVMIEGNLFIVEDRKNSRYGCEWVDIWFESRELAIEWGIKEITIIIYK